MDKIKSNIENAIEKILISVEELAEEMEKIETSGITDKRKEWKTIINKGILSDFEIHSEYISEFKSNIETLCILNKSLTKKVKALENINDIRKEEIEKVLNMTQTLLNIAKEMQSVFNQNYSDDIDLSNEHILVSGKQIVALLQILDLAYLFDEYSFFPAFFINKIVMKYGTPNKKIRTIKEDDVIENKYVIELINKYIGVVDVNNIIKYNIFPIELGIVSCFIEFSEKDIEKFNKKSN